MDSDVLKLLYRNGEKVPNAFVVDAGDREIIAWRAVVGTGISGSEVDNLMLETVEKRLTLCVRQSPSSGSLPMARPIR